MSSINGPITRSEVISRAQNWVDRRVPYSMSAYASDPDCGKTYRQDCSGYVSMCWHLDTSLTTSTLPGRATTIAKTDVKPGDALAYPGHVALVASPPSGGNVTIYQQRGPGHVAQKVTNPLSMYDTNAYRYNNIRNDTPPPPPPPPTLKGEKDMILHEPNGPAYLLSGGVLFPIHTPGPQLDLRAQGVPFTTMDTDTWVHLGKRVIW